MSLTIYSDNLTEGLWFQSLSPRLAGAQFALIRSRGSHDPAIDALIAYDRPDIILVSAGKPVLVVEKTREVPTGHNIGQRTARLVRALELGVPAIAFLPFDARKHGTHSSICNLNARILRSFASMSAIHGVPILTVNWPSDAHGELIDDGTENDSIATIVDDFLAHNFSHTTPSMLAQLQHMEAEYARRLKVFRQYAQPPNSVAILNTFKILAGLGDQVSDNGKRQLSNRAETVLYTINMTPDACRREDPYTGMQFIYDYLLCRSGPEAADKHRNLVLRFPNITRARWSQANPNDPTRKSCNWYLTANALWYKDGADILR